MVEMLMSHFFPTRLLFSTLTFHPIAQSYVMSSTRDVDLGVKVWVTTYVK